MTASLKFVLVCVIIAVECANLKHGSKQLKSVILVHRHGDRTPVSTFSGDPNVQYWLYYGLSSLTDQGEQRMKDVGKYFKERYRKIWPSENDVYLRSSMVERCYQSVQCLISGAYNDNFLSNPIPIVNVPTTNDSMLYPSFHCLAFNQETVRVLYLPENVQWYENYKPLASYLTEKCGTCGATLDSVFYLIDNIISSRAHNLPIPVWINETILKQFDDIANHYYAFFCTTELQQRLSAGMFLNEIIKQMNAIQKHRKFQTVKIYSTHDFLIIELLSALGVINPKPPPFGSTIMFEFWSDNNETKNFVRLYYLNDTYSENPHLLNIKSCDGDEFCSFEKFSDQITKFIPDDWVKECGQII
ncbi:lysosomal acid phosphatase-like protein 3 [Leptotrombidium deliense]|uniref:Lysosomal acid phosphatase-like protein 3 n=1 Tax=Leptotrombidium deliense TaxID=299467 RepID=A0A443S3S0_9ACAR|nr:lysosomal acid phosphatase-like protein 3 [Leptotrombidium deliense]